MPCGAKLRRRPAPRHAVGRAPSSGCIGCLPRAACSPDRAQPAMFTYVVQRTVFGLAVLIGTSLITFAIAFVVPADPAVAVAGAKADPATLASIRRELGLDQPLYRQYARYAYRALHGDLGRSYIRREEVTGLILSRFPATAILALSALTLALALGIPMGILGAAWRD